MVNSPPLKRTSVQGHTQLGPLMKLTQLSVDKGLLTCHLASYSEQVTVVCLIGFSFTQLVPLLH